MNKRTISRILVAGAFFALVMVGVNAMAQAAHPAIPSTTGQVPAKGSPTTKAEQTAAQSNPACQQILTECKNLGFIVGQWKKDNGLWKDCFDPVVNGGSPTRDGKPIKVPVSPSVVQQCQASRGHKQAGQAAGGQTAKPSAQPVKP